MKDAQMREKNGQQRRDRRLTRGIGSIAGALCMVLALLLLLTAAPQSTGTASATAFAAAPPSLTTAGDENAAGHGIDQVAHDDGDELYGQLLFTVTAFLGDWVVEAGNGETITVVLTANTEVKRFGGQLPSPGQWLKAEGVYLPDGRFEAQKIRPDNSEANQVIVRLKPGADPERTVTALAEEYEMRVESVLQSANIYLFTTVEDEEDEVNSLLTDERIAWAELNRVSRVPTGSPYRTWKWGGAEDSDYQNQHAFEQVNLSSASEIATGAGVTIAILDTGIDLQHPAFSGRLSILPSSDMISDTDVPDDIGPGLAWGHGTHVAGVINAIAPSAQLMPIRILDSQGRGNTFVLAYAIEYAISQGADILNLSLGADCRSQILNEVIGDALAQGVVIVAAAGNDADGVPQCPASMPGVLSVAAVEETRVRAEWSNYGEWVSLAAPGVGITSTFPLGYNVEITSTPGYASWSGTSMATPFVSGAAALLLEREADFLHSMTIGERLTTFGDDISALNPPPLSVGRHLNIGSALTGDLPDQPISASFTLFLPSVTR